MAASRSLLAWMRAAFNAAGGVFWHLEAWRFSRRRWRAYRRRIRGWLEGWRPSERRLLLVGPSAGWVLDRRLFDRFDVVVALDPDPLSPWLFRRRFRQAQVAFSADDYFGPREDALRIDRLDALFDAYPDHAVLFCNVLSQLPGLFPEATGATSDPPTDTPRFRDWKRRLRQRLSERSWASFHDRLSSDRAPAQEVLALPAELDSLALAERCYHVEEGEAIAVFDHQLTDIAPDLPRHLVDWPRRPGLHHVVELLAVAR
ncbi:MAG: hypothetical protein RIT45_3995 [Pseudomonadota bacterium]